MSFMNHLSALAPRPALAPRRRRAPLRLETLEGRDLMSNVPGVSLSYGMISIQSQTSAGSAAQVDRVGDTIRVSLNGQVATFGAYEVSSIAYSGSANGWDSFTNNTNLYSQVYTYGGHNSIAGGSYYNYVVMRGDFNAYDSRGGAGLVYSYDGPHTSISQIGNNYVYSYSTASYLSYFF